MVGFDRYAHILLISIPTYGIFPLFTSVWRYIANSGYFAMGSPVSPKFRAVELAYWSQQSWIFRVQVIPGIQAS